MTHMANYRADMATRFTAHVACRKLAALATMAALVSCLSASAFSGTLQEGIAARDRADYASALDVFRQLAAAGNADGQFQLSLLYAAGKGVPGDSKQALYWLKEAAVHGHGPAQSNLGVAFNRGRGVPQNAIKAYAWLQIAAASGDRLAITNRDLVARKLTAVQLAQARALAQDCLQNHFKACL